jgi:hypothetical protein
LSDRLFTVFFGEIPIFKAIGGPVLINSRRREGAFMGGFSKISKGPRAETKPLESSVISPFSAMFFSSDRTR